MLAKNQLMCLDDYIDDYGAETKEVLGEEFLKSTSTLFFTTLPHGPQFLCKTILLLSL